MAGITSHQIFQRKSEHMLDFLFEKANRIESASFSPHFVKTFMQSVIKCLTLREAK